LNKTPVDELQDSGLLKVPLSYFFPPPFSSFIPFFPILSSLPTPNQKKKKKEKKNEYFVNQLLLVAHRNYGMQVPQLWLGLWFAVISFKIGGRTFVLFLPNRGFLLYTSHLLGLCPSVYYTEIELFISILSIYFLYM
jgi:hypothetical protein